MADAVMAGTKVRHFKWAINASTGIVGLTAEAIGQKREFNVSELDKGFTGLGDIGKQLFAYGAKQLLSDRVAHLPKTEDKLSEMSEVWEDLLGGIWSEKREGGGKPSVTLLHEAIARVTGKDVARIVEVFTHNSEAMSPADFKAWKKSYADDQGVKAAYAAIQAERAKEAAKAAKGKPATADLSAF